MNLILVLALSLVCGMMIAAQAAINTELSRHLGSPAGAVLVSLATSAVLMLPFALAQGGRLRLEALGTAPWWAWIGGAAGAAFLTAGLLFSPRIGVALFLMTAMAGQLLAAALIDHHGLFGMSVRAIDLPRVVGLLLVFAGILVFRLLGR